MRSELLVVASLIIFGRPPCYFNGSPKERLIPARSLRALESVCSSPADSWRRFGKYRIQPSCCNHLTVDLPGERRKDCPSSARMVGTRNRVLTSQLLELWLDLECLERGEKRLGHHGWNRAAFCPNGEEQQHRSLFQAPTTFLLC